MALNKQATAGLSRGGLGDFFLQNFFLFYSEFFYVFFVEIFSNFFPEIFFWNFSHRGGPLAGELHFFCCNPHFYDTFWVLLIYNYLCRAITSPKTQKMRSGSGGTLWCRIFLRWRLAWPEDQSQNSPEAHNLSIKTPFLACRPELHLELKNLKQLT